MGTTSEVLEKLRGLDGPKLLAVVDSFGGRENLDAVLRGEKKIILEDVIKKLIDKNGRCIPARELKSNVYDPDNNFKLVRPQSDPTAQFNRFVKFFSRDMQFVSSAEFEKRSVELVSQLRRDALLSNLLEGAYFPVCFPKLEISDYGESLEKIFLFAAEKSCKEKFPNRSFKNYRKGELARNVEIVPGSRHEKLLAKMAEGPVVGIQFFPMQGFSINASREQMLLLPESLMLSGGIDIMTAMAMYPDVLGRDFNTPGYFCSATSWKSVSYSLVARTYDDHFYFSLTDSLVPAYGDYSSGLLFIG